MEILQENMEAKKDLAQGISRAKRKIKCVNPEPYTQEKCPSGMKGKSRHSQVKEN